MTSWLHRVANYDVFPEFSARFRRVVYTPLGVLVGAALVALLCGLFLHPQGYALCAGLLAAVLLGVAWPWLSLRGLHGSVSFDQLRVTEGEAVDVCVRLRNRLPWSAWGLAVRDAGGPTASIAIAPGRRRGQRRWSFVPLCRGVYPRGLVRLTTGFPFGLWESGKVLAVEEPLLVWPRTYPVGPVPCGDGERLLEGSTSRHKVGGAGDVLGLRPYRRGDSLRRVHWGQSACHDRLIVCELEHNARPVLQVVLDAEAASHPGGGPGGSREWAIRIVASLASGWLEAGAQVGLVASGLAVPPAAGRQQVPRLLDALARLGDGGKTLAEVLAGPACATFRDGLQVIVTTDVGLARLGRPGEVDRQRWVVLRSAGFGGPPAAGAWLASAWLGVDRAEDVPARLRGEWKEARHGS